MNKYEPLALVPTGFVDACEAVLEREDCLLFDPPLSVG